MIRGVIDTHAVIWHLYNEPLLSPTVRAFLMTSAAQGDQVGVSAITIVEIVYLVEKGRIQHDALVQLQTALDTRRNVLAIVPIGRLIAESMPSIDRSRVPDMPDRIIAATALHLGVPLLSKDAKLKASGITTIW